MLSGSITVTVNMMGYRFTGLIILPVTLQAEDGISDLAPASSPRTFVSEFRVPGEMVDEGRSVIRLFNVD